MFSSTLIFVLLFITHLTAYLSMSSSDRKQAGEFILFRFVPRRICDFYLSFW